MEKHILHIILLDISTVCVYVWYSQDFHFCGWVSVYVHTFCAKQVVGHDHFKFVLVNKTITTKFTYKQLLISYIYKLLSSWRLRPSSIPVNPSDHLTSSDTIATMSGKIYCIIEKKHSYIIFRASTIFLGHNPNINWERYFFALVQYLWKLINYLLTSIPFHTHCIFIQMKNTGCLTMLRIYGGFHLSLQS